MMYSYRGIASKSQSSVPPWFPSFLSKEAQEKRTKKLKQDLKEGYFRDIHEFHRTKGKLFHAGTSVIPEAESVRLQGNISGRTIYGKRVSIMEQIGISKPTATLIALSHNRLAYDHTLSFINTFMKEFNGPNFACYELIVLEKWILYSFLLPWMWINNWRSTGHDRIQFKLYKYGSLGSQLDYMGNIYNKLVGYVWILDSQCRIRWMATGNATTLELLSMKEIVQQLQ